MNIRCPHCETRYLLPDHLMGAGGARVRCPRCTQSFLVSPEGDVRPVLATAPGPASAPAAAPPAAPAAAAPPAVPASPETEAARRILADLAERHGRPIESAIARGRLFSEHGQRLVEAFEAWRREVGRGADPEPFRAALRERFGVDLTPHWGEPPR